MGWSNIDFALIQKGMITKKNDDVSFADYLNQFQKALVERKNITTPTSGDVLTYTPVFFTGEIRVPSNNAFWTNFRALIDGYSNLWFSSSYYTVGVLGDVINSADYKITDADLEIAIGEEAYNILTNVSALSNQEIFKASILQALFTIYQKTQYVSMSMRSRVGGLDGTDVSYNSLVFYEERKRIDQAYFFTFENPETHIIREQRIGAALNSHTFIQANIDGDGFKRGNWSDYRNFCLACRSLSGNLLNMEYTLGASILTTNNIDETSVYISRYPFSNGTNISVEPYIASEFQDSDYGTTKEQYLISGKGTGEPPIPSSGIGNFGLEYPPIGYVNLNNPALEFSI